MAISILWRRLDRPGHEACRVERRADGWGVSGSSVFGGVGGPCRLDYSIVTDAAWRTVSARVEGWSGERSIAIEIAADSRSRWSMNGEPQPAVEGCIDIDLNFSPSTNLLPIRRLALPVGKEATVRAAWLRFPSFTLEPLEQRYLRAAERAYCYESAGGGFVADLEVDDFGLVTRYPGFFEVEPAG
jgi:uncharacterized protein